MDFDIQNNPIINGSWDVVVVGAGAAGLMTCIELPEKLNVLLVNRNTSKRSASRWAQGGIASVTRREDSLQSHFEDTVRAGSGLCDLDSVRMLVEEAPKCVERLQQLGMEFDKDENGLSTTLEAAHSFRRVLHVKDQTGRALVDVLREQVEKKSNVLHRRGVRVTQLWVENGACHGVQVLDGNCLYWIPARAVVLASGGGGHLFGNTTNPEQACGEGVALAWKAGAAIEDLEFFQFHPTALKMKGAPSFLISEAVRGEGGVLLDGNGNSPVSNLISKDLAPRDQLSRALVKVMESQQVNHMKLDFQGISAEKVNGRFPSIIEKCREVGLDPLKQLIPVAPAAHYWMGGVATDLQAATSLPGLYAVGEVACTGVHGANRLASNSLLECIVFARKLSCIKLVASLENLAIPRRCVDFEFSFEKHNIFSEESLKSSIEALRQLFWKEVGVNRSKKGMKNALKSISFKLDLIAKNPLLSLLENQTKDSCIRLSERTRKKINLILDLMHRQQSSKITLNACLFRCESRGGHFRFDYPSSLPHWEYHSRQIKGKNISTRSIRL